MQSAAILTNFIQLAIDFSGAFRGDLFEESAVKIYSILLTPVECSDSLTDAALHVDFLVPLGMVTPGFGSLDAVAELLLGGLLIIFRGRVLSAAA